MAKIDFGGVVENVVTREEFPLSKAREVLKNEVVAVIGYGVQGPAQAMNMKDNGINVIIGQAPEFKTDWDKAIGDGFVPGKTLFPVEEAVKKGTIIQYLVSDAAQRILWPKLKPSLRKAMHYIFLMDFQSLIKNILVLSLLIMSMLSWLHQKDPEQVSGVISLQEQELTPVIPFSRIYRKS